LTTGTKTWNKYATIKEEIVDWGIPDGPTLANMHLAQGHLDEQIEVEGELTKRQKEKEHFWMPLP
jgi:hypothetical protein